MQTVGDSSGPLGLFGYLDIVQMFICLPRQLCDRLGVEVAPAAVSEGGGYMIYVTTF